MVEKHAVWLLKMFVIRRFSVMHICTESLGLDGMVVQLSIEITLLYCIRISRLRWLSQVVWQTRVYYIVPLFPFLLSTMVGA